MNRTMNMMLIALLALATVMGILKDCFHPKSKNELVVAGHHVDTAPLQSAMNLMFEGAVDSVQVCACLIPKFYPLLQNDTTKMQKFEEMGFFPLEGAANNSVQQLFADCVSANVLDTAYKLHLSSFFGQPMLQRLHERFAPYEDSLGVNINTFVRSVMDSVDGKLTIREYFSSDFTQIPWVRKMILGCIQQNRQGGVMQKE